MDDIINTETRGGNDFEGIAILYKKIFTFLMFKNKQVGLNYAQAMLRPGGGLNSLTSLTTAILHPQYAANIINTMEREVAAALESVLPRPALRPFVAMSPPEKVN